MEMVYLIGFIFYVLNKCLASRTFEGSQRASLYLCHNGKEHEDRTVSRLHV